MLTIIIFLLIIILGISAIFVVGFEGLSRIISVIVAFLAFIAIIVTLIIYIKDNNNHNHEIGVVVDKYQAHEKVNGNYHKVYYIDVYYDDCGDTLSYKLTFPAWNVLQIDSEFKIMEEKKWQTIKKR